MISPTLLERFEKWAGKHASIERHAMLSYIAFLYEVEGATLESVGQKLGVSGELVRLRLAEREYLLLCESRRLMWEDLSAIACPYPECGCALSYNSGPPVPPTVCPRGLMKGWPRV